MALLFVLMLTVLLGYSLKLLFLCCFVAILTAAMEMLGGGQEIASSCRKPEIMADAAYAVLTKDSRSFTGNFAIDEFILKDVGVEDMEQYACVPGRF